MDRPDAVAEILAGIDAALGCQQCGGELGESPSGDFCGQDCQERWHAARAERLVGYREPWQRPGDFPGIGGEAHRFGGAELVPALRYMPVPTRPPSVFQALLTGDPPAEVERRGWRLPRATGDLAADLREAQVAGLGARTPAQHAAVRERLAALRERRQRHQDG